MFSTGGSRLFSRGKAENTEFGGKYNLLTNNCNDFVIAMAKAAGAEAPAELHDSIFGPMVAYKNLANAAQENDLKGGTRIFQGGEIKNIVLNAAFYGAEDGAEVRMEHIMKAVYRELTKARRIALNKDYGMYGYMLHD